MLGWATSLNIMKGDLPKSAPRELPPGWVGLVWSLQGVGWLLGTILGGWRVFCLVGSCFPFLRLLSCTSLCTAEARKPDNDS